jgi:probable rRNA maturation factor
LSKRRSKGKAVAATFALKLRYRTYLGAVGRVLRFGLSRLKKEGFLEVYLVDDGTIRQLNSRYRGKNCSTNVLAFPWPRGFISADLKSKPLGEIYLAPDYIRKHGEDLELLALHGLLHLLGYDHKTKRDRFYMEHLEQRLLKNFRKK